MRAGGHFLRGPGSGHRHPSPPPKQAQRNDAHFQGEPAHAGLRRAARHHDQAPTRSDRLLQGRQDLARHTLAEILSGPRVGGESRAPSGPVACRRVADADPNQKILGETAKLVGNAGFGRFIVDVGCHQEVRYEQDKSKVACAINSFFFHDLEEVSEEVFELKIFKKKIKCDLPIQIGFFVFTYAKLRVLEFYYHCIIAFLDRRDFQYLEMDTDSAYMSLAGDSLEELVQSDKKEEFAAIQHRWFPRHNTPEHATYDKRKPGLFKVEWKETVLWGSTVRPILLLGRREQQSQLQGHQQETQRTPEGGVPERVADAPKSIRREPRTSRGGQQGPDLRPASDWL